MATKLVLEPRELMHYSFAPYGRILEPMKGEEPEVYVTGSFEFYVPLRVEAMVWQIGFLILQNTSVDKLERHTGTPEVFSPLQGQCAVIVSVDGTNPIAFRLTRPISLNPGIWHGVVQLSGQPTVLIAENGDVTDDFLPLERSITCKEK
jgi:ureidoglycolate hydrolase